MSSILLSLYLGLEFLDNMVILCLIYWGITKWVSSAAGFHFAFPLVNRRVPTPIHPLSEASAPPVILVLPAVRIPGRERRLLETMQLAIGEFITDSSQGLPPSPRVWGRKAPSPSSLGYLLGTVISWHQWIGYTVGSWPKRIGYTVARQFLLV